MGLEAVCTVSYQEQRSAGKARLEPERLQFRGDFRLDIALRDIASAEARRGALVVKFGEAEAAFDLGGDAGKWALKIRYPRSRAQKLGLKAGLRVRLVGLKDEQLLGELEESECGIVARAGERKVDIIFFQVGQVADLARLTELRQSIQPAGAIWVVAPKGSKIVRERDVLGAGKAHGLTDIKVVSFSETQTAHKFVIPVANRRLG